MQKKVYLFMVIIILSISLFTFNGCGGVASLLTTAASTSLGGMEVWVFVPDVGAKNTSHTSKVTPPSGFIALPGATLTIVGTSKSAVTDSSGYASITGLASGTYTVTVAKEGYKTYSYTVTVTTGVDTEVGGSGGIQTEVSTTPGIMDLSATSGVTTASITITGVNFSSTQGTSTVTFGGVSATTITSWSSTQIVCAAPVGAVTGNVVVTVNSEASNGVPFTVTGEGLPSAPSNLTATAASVTQINLSWTANSTNETGFKIERKPGAGGTYAQIATVGAGVTAYDNTGVSGGINYYYRVRAYNIAGNSGYSNETNVLTTLPAPSGLTATAISSSRIDLSWTSNSTTETGFKIERKTGSGGAYVEIATVGAGVTSYNNTGRTDGTTYYYRVRAYNDTGDSGYSNEANASTTLPAPSGLAATAASSTQINLAWTRNSTTETGFKIERKTDGTYAQIATVGAGVTSYNNTSLTSGTNYYYRVRAYNDTGDSSYSNEANATTDFKVTYSGNANSGGNAPEDSNDYHEGDTVTVLGNTGSLAKINVEGVSYRFVGWNTLANGTGTDRAPDSTFTMGTANVILYAKWTAYALRDTGPAGGLIFYIANDYSEGWKYMEAAPSDQAAALKWGTDDSVLIGTLTDIGTGLENTNAIVLHYGAGTTYAAGLCDALVSGGYSDWFLPSQAELAYMYNELKGHGNPGSFADDFYWCSSEYSDSLAYMKYFFDGWSTYDAKSATTYIDTRAARRF